MLNFVRPPPLASALANPWAALEHVCPAAETCTTAGNPRDLQGSGRMPMRNLLNMEVGIAALEYKGTKSHHHVFATR